MRGRRVLMESFVAHGVRHIFGNPGTTETPLLDSLPAFPQIDYIMALHEGVAVGAASFYAQKKLAAMLVFGAQEWAQFACIVIPFAAMTSALQMLICTYGRSYREAQTYVSYLATAVSFVPVIVIFSGLKDAAWQLVVPQLKWATRRSPGLTNRMNSGFSWFKSV